MMEQRNTQYGEEILAKERELERMKQLRTGQLEKMIEQRDQLLLESSKSFEKLKDDFQYNLCLIEARDKEITRLERVLEEQVKRNEDLEIQYNELHRKVDSMQLKEKERQEKIEQDKSMNKRILNELKAVIDSMQWSAEEENKTKLMEISYLKREISALQRAKDEALDLQRKDLTQAFENIITQREEFILTKENELAHQISLLDQRFEKLQTENLQGKALQREYKLQLETQLLELTRVEDAHRMLTYQLEDLHKNKDALEDSLKRQLTSQSADFTRQLDTLQHSKHDLAMLLEKERQEKERIQESNYLLEKRIEDLSLLAKEESATLHSENVTWQRSYHSLEQEVQSLKLERENLLMKVSNKRLEYETLQTKYSLINEEIAHKNENQQHLTKNQLSLEQTLTQLQKEYDHYKSVMEKEYSQLQESSQRKLEDLKEKSEYNLQREREDKASKITELTAHYEEKLQQHEQDYQHMITRKDEYLLQQMKEKEAEIVILRGQLQGKDNQLMQERQENEAMKLRVMAESNQLAHAMREIKQLKRQLDGNNGGIGKAAGTGTGMEIMLPSPMMMSVGGEEEYGNIMNRTFASELSPSPLGGGGGVSSPARYGHNKGNNGGIASFPLPSSSTTGGQPQQQTQQYQLLQQDNETLKKVISNLRKEMEEMHSLYRSPAPPLLPPPPPAQVVASKGALPNSLHRAASTSSLNSSNSSNASQQPRNSGGGGKDHDRIKQLETTINQMQQEMSHVKADRKKLMDVSNELRYTLYKIEDKTTQQTHAAVETARVQNVDTVYRWINNNGNDRTRTTSVQNVWDDDYFRTTNTGTSPAGNATGTRRASTGGGGAGTGSGGGAGTTSFSPPKRQGSMVVSSSNANNTGRTAAAAAPSSISRRHSQADFSIAPFQRSPAASGNNYAITTTGGGGVDESFASTSSAGGAQPTSQTTAPNYTKPIKGNSATMFRRNSTGSFAPVSNSDRTTSSQMQALQKIKLQKQSQQQQQMQQQQQGQQGQQQQQGQQGQQQQTTQRKIMNYAEHLGQEE